MVVDDVDSGGDVDLTRRLAVDVDEAPDLCVDLRVIDQPGETLQVYGGEPRLSVKMVWGDRNTVLAV